MISVFMTTRGGGGQLEFPLDTFRQRLHSAGFGMHVEADGSFSALDQSSAQHTSVLVIPRRNVGVFDGSALVLRSILPTRSGMSSLVLDPTFARSRCPGRLHCTNSFSGARPGLHQRWNVWSARVV